MDMRIVGFARKIAGKSTHVNYPMVALSLRGGNIIEWGVNRYTKQDWPKTTHCERHLLEKLAERGVGNLGKILVLRFRGNGSLGMARPCESCLEKLRDAGIRRVTFSDDSEGFTEERLR